MVSATLSATDVVDRLLARRLPELAKRINYAGTIEVRLRPGKTPQILIVQREVVDEAKPVN